MRASYDDRRRLLLAGLSNEELKQHIDVARTEEARLALQLARDRAALDAGPSRAAPLGKLRSRMSWTQLKCEEYRARQAAAEAELRRRGAFNPDDCDEPALTDLERLVARLGRRDPSNR